MKNIICLNVPNEYVFDFYTKLSIIPYFSKNIQEIFSEVLKNTCSLKQNKIILQKNHNWIWIFQIFISSWRNLKHTAVNKESFLLLYLYSDRIEENIETIRKKHGYSSFEDVIAHFRHRQRLEMRIIDEIIGEKAVVLLAKEWKTEDIIPVIDNL